MLLLSSGTRTLCWWRWLLAGAAPWISLVSHPSPATTAENYSFLIIILQLISFLFPRTGSNWELGGCGFSPQVTKANSAQFKPSLAHRVVPSAVNFLNGVNLLNGGETLPLLKGTTMSLGKQRAGISSLTWFGLGAE